MTTRLIGWIAFVAAFSALAYGAQFSGDEPAKDIAYRWSSSIAGLIEYSLVFGLVMLLTRGLDRRAFLAFRPPSISWLRVTGISVLIVIAVFVVSAAVSPFGNPEQEQGLIPSQWNSHRLAQFAAYAAVVTLVGPFVEELMFRGVGYGLLERYGQSFAIVAVGVAFALVHGLVAGFPVIAVFGIGLAYLRARTESIYPCIVLHAAFNAFGLAVGVST